MNFLVYSLFAQLLKFFNHLHFFFKNLLNSSELIIQKSEVYLVFLCDSYFGQFQLTVCFALKFLQLFVVNVSVFLLLVDKLFDHVLLFVE